MTFETALRVMLIPAIALLTGCDPRDDSVTTGNEWASADFSTDSGFVSSGSEEFVQFLSARNTYEIDSEASDKLSELLAEHGPCTPEEIDHFSVVVREKLQELGQVDSEDSGRVQYTISQLVTILNSE